MLYSSYRGTGGSFRGKTWKLSNGYTRACNYKGQQCTFKLQNEASRFAEKGKPTVKQLNEAVKTVNEASREVTMQAVRTRGEAESMAQGAQHMSSVRSTYVKDLPNGQFQLILVMKNLVKEGKLQEGRAKSYYMPELGKREMDELSAALTKQGYKVKVKGPNLVTDASEKEIRSSLLSVPYSIHTSPDYRSKREELVGEAKSSYSLHAMGNGWSHSKTISANSQKEAETQFRNDPRFRRQARQAEERWQEVPIVGDREAKSKFAKTTKKKVEPAMDRSTFLSRIKGPAQTAPQHYATSPSKRRGR